MNNMEMTEERAREILSEALTENGTIDDGLVYWKPGIPGITLDGEPCPEDYIHALSWWMRNKGGEDGTQLS